MRFLKKRGLIEKNSSLATIPTAIVKKTKEESASNSALVSI